jgi:hypothetical protein
MRRCVLGEAKDVAPFGERVGIASKAFKLVLNERKRR